MNAICSLTINENENAAGLSSFGHVGARSLEVVLPLLAGVEAGVKVRDGGHLEAGAKFVLGAVQERAGVGAERMAPIYVFTGSLKLQQKH